VIWVGPRFLPRSAITRTSPLFAGTRRSRGVSIAACGWRIGVAVGQRQSVGTKWLKKSRAGVRTQLRMIKPITLILVAVLVGCASVGRKLDPQKVAQIRNGMSRQEVIGLVGSPDQMTRTGGGETVFLYHYARATAKAESFIPIAGAFMGGANVQNQMLQVVFSAEGVVKDFTSTYGATETGVGASSGSGVKLEDVESGKREK
jgi:outer membrane protein assembly factor BamE (lipoprotein component of BamABCDE complex)